MDHSARCDKCRTLRERCKECASARLLRTIKLACADSGLCQCTHDTEVSSLESVRQIEHTVKLWRWRSCVCTSQHPQALKRERNARKHKHKPPADEEQQQPKPRHVVQRDVSSTMAFLTLLVIDLHCNGRSESFCRQIRPFHRLAESNDSVQYCCEIEYNNNHRNLQLPTADEIDAARCQIAKTRLDLVRHRAAEICIGLQSLEINALQLCEIMMHSFGAVGSLIAFHQWWAIATKVKHFNNKEK